MNIIYQKKDLSEPEDTFCCEFNFTSEDDRVETKIRCCSCSSCIPEFLRYLSCCKCKITKKKEKIISNNIINNGKS